MLELVDREFNNIATEIEEYSLLVKSDTKTGDLHIEINSTSTKSYLDYKFANLISKSILTPERTVPRDAIREMKLMGFEFLNELDAKIPIDLSKKVTQFIHSKENYIGFLRTILMIIDIDKYFSKAWREGWHRIDYGTFSLLKSYNIEMEAYLKKYEIDTW